MRILSSFSRLKDIPSRCVAEDVLEKAEHDVKKFPKFNIMPIVIDMIKTDAILFFVPDINILLTIREKRC